MLEEECLEIVFFWLAFRLLRFCPDVIFGQFLLKRVLSGKRSRLQVQPLPSAAIKHAVKDSKVITPNVVGLKAQAAQSSEVTRSPTNLS